MQMKQFVIRMAAMVSLAAVNATISVAQTAGTPADSLQSSVTISARETGNAVIPAPGVTQALLREPQSLPLPLPLPRREITRGKAIALGIVIGGAIGATAGYLIGRDNCDNCNDSMSAAVPTALGAVGGAALGAFVAAQNVPPGQPQMSHLPTSRKLAGFRVATFR